MRSARVRLVLLWLSSVGRVLADWALRITAFLELRDLGGPDRDSAWHLITAVFIAPFILLAPLHGCLSNALPRRWVLTGAALVCVAAVALFLPASPLSQLQLQGGPWLWALALMAIGSGLFSVTRYAMLPAIARDAQLPLTRVIGWIELGGVSAIIGGIILGLRIAGDVEPGLPRTVVLVLLLNLFALAAALFCSFPSDVRRPEPPLQAIGGFFRDCARIFRKPEARSSLLALSVFQGVVTAGSGAVFTMALNQEAGSHDDALFALVLVTIGVAVGCGLSALQSSTRRSLGLVPLGLTGLALAQVWAAIAGTHGIAPAIPSFLLGVMGGLINVPLRSCYLAAVPADARGNAMSVMNASIYLITTLIALLMVGLVHGGILTSIQSQLWLIALLVALGAILAWKVLLPQLLELFAEWLILPMYRIRVHGPGANSIPESGPLLLIANHSTYFDPVFVSKVTPRRIRPLMLSRFFDLPVIRWLMTNVVRAIRVPQTRFRREAPELQEVIAELKREGCVLIFPEGILRRKEERLMRQFGQGVWHILKEVPHTPVVVIWIEGGWGSWASYKDGPPMQNKKLDFRRRIDIVIAEPQVLPPEVLADQRMTRRYLMRACLEGRRILGLEVPIDLMAVEQTEEENEG